MDFHDLSVADAERYRDCIVADGPIRLAELARLLEADGVDLDQFDASIRSLIPLWSWYLGFATAGYPGIPADAQPRILAVESRFAEIARAVYASEFLMHYLFEVARKYLHDVAWVVERRRNLTSTHRTQVKYVDDDGFRGMWELDTYTTVRSDGANPRSPARINPSFLADQFGSVGIMFGLSTRERVAATPRSGVSILVGLGDPGPAQPPLVFHPASEGQGETSDTDEEFGDELMLADRRANPEEIQRARKLDAGKVAHVLNRLGFTTDSGAPITTDGILAEEYAEYVREDDAALIATETYRGRLRALHLDAAAPTKEAWEEIMTALTGLAKTLKAKLARPDEFGPEDWE